MQNLFITILIFFLPFFFCNFSIVFGARTLAGVWKPINATDPTVIEIGKFAVDEHDKDAHVSLKFEKVVGGESQVVAGMQYKITIMADNGVEVNNYVALVWDKPRQKFRQLVYFDGPSPVYGMAMSSGIRMTGLYGSIFNNQAPAYILYSMPQG